MSFLEESSEVLLIESAGFKAIRTVRGVMVDVNRDGGEVQQPVRAAGEKPESVHKLRRLGTRG